MRILITGSRSKVGRALVKALALGNDIRTMDLADGDGPAPTFEGDGRDGAIEWIGLKP